MRIVYLLAVLAVFLGGCKKNNQNINVSTELKIKPLNLNCGNDQVRVRLYESEADFNTFGTTPLREEYSTGNNGVHFKGLEQKVYYFRCTKVCNNSYDMTNIYCEAAKKVYRTNGSLNPNQIQEIEVLMCK